MGPKISMNFVRYSLEFFVTVIVLTEFDCSCSCRTNLQTWCFTSNVIFDSVPDDRNRVAQPGGATKRGLDPLHDPLSRASHPHVQVNQCYKNFTRKLVLRILEKV